MTRVIFERKDLKLFMTLRQDDDSRSLLKILGDSQVAQLLDIATDLLPERALFPSAEERNFVTNDEFDFVQVETEDDQPAVYRLQVKNGPTSFDQFDFNEEDLNDFINALNDIRTDEEFTQSLEIGPEITSAVAGPTGPTGPLGPTGPSGDIDNNKLIVIKTEDQEYESTDLEDDNELRLSVDGSSRYQFEVRIFVTIASLVPDIKMSISGPATVLFRAGYIVVDNTSGEVNPPSDGTVVVDSLNATVVHNFSGGTTPNSMIMISGSIQGDSDGGIMIFRFAQSTSNATPVIIKKGSSIVAKKI